MAFRALLFSKGTETNSAVAEACQNAGFRLETCSDIFSAIEKATKQNFSCLLVDWCDQPEAGFLLKRARESMNTGAVAIAIVDVEPTANEMRDHRLNFLIYRPVAPTEAQDVLAKASESMQSVSGGNMADASSADEQPSGPDADASGLDGAEVHEQATEAEEIAADANEGEYDAGEDERPVRTAREFPVRRACAAAVVLIALYCLWHARDTIGYLAQTHEKKSTIFKDSLAALFYFNPSAATPMATAGTETQPDPYFNRTPAPDSTSAAQPQLGVVSTEAEVSESRVHLPKPADFPLPTPVYVHEDPPPVEATARRASIPDSLRSSQPIAPPVVVTVNPAQMMPVSSPSAPPLGTQQFSEPVSVTEQAARALLVHSVDPTYPPEALPQKLHGPVVLQATIGRDGSVEDLKIVRGSFILCRAAIAAVKQWRFQPYTLNGHAAEAQTVLTINFTGPSS